MPDAANPRIVQGILLMIGFATLAPGIDIFAKLATQTMPPGQVALARFSVQAVVLWPLIAALGRLRFMTPRALGLHALRGLLMSIATTAFIAAISRMPVADAISIFFVEPLILTLLSAWLLKEPVGPRRIAACLAGFVGALIVVRPSFQDLGWVATLPLVTAVTFAFYLLLTRHMAPREDPLTMQATSGVFGMIFVGLALAVGSQMGLPAFDPVWPAGRDWALLAGVGVMATASHLLLVYAFRLAPASILAPLQYLEIIAATAFGFWVFGDFPDAVKWLGIAIIVGSGLYVFMRERQLSRR